MEKKKEIKTIADKYFGNTPKHELPTFEQMLQALELAKGKKFMLSPKVIDAIKQNKADGNSPGAICILCDTQDICKLCDVADCWPNMRDIV